MASKYKQSHPQAGPGPGAYSTVTSATSSTGSTFGSGQREVRENRRTSTPGPGSYASSHDNLSPRAGAEKNGFTKAKRGTPFEVKETGPGPGNYNAELAKTESVYSVPHGKRGSSLGTVRTESPGPGAYGVVSSIADSTATRASFGSALQRHNRRPVTSPGPKTYSDRQLRPSSPSAGFGSATRAAKQTAESSAPHCYDLGVPKSSASYSMASKCKQASPEEGPGPGQYIMLESQLTGGSSFGTGQREVPERNRLTGPGPGTYDFQGDMSPRTSGESLKFSKAKRFESNASDTGPGPGNYSSDNTKTESSHSIPRATRGPSPAKPCSNPGPGQYGSGLTSKTGHQFPKSPRWRPSGSESGPGPGTHDPEALKAVLPKWTFGNSCRSGPAATDVMPGPSDYSGANHTSFG